MNTMNTNITFRNIFRLVSFFKKYDSMNESFKKVSDSDYVLYHAMHNPKRMPVIENMTLEWNILDNGIEYATHYDVEFESFTSVYKTRFEEMTIYVIMECVNEYDLYEEYSTKVFYVTVE